MKRRLSIIAVIALVLMLSGCCLSHDWQPATCELPESCSKCDKTQGEALGHTWGEADCVTPITCSVCGATDGEALGHTWVDADCVTAKTCSVCGEVEGEALGHTWVDADCVTAKTCSVCGETEGEALGHTWVDANCVTAKTCSVCGETEGEALGHTWVDANCVTAKTCSVCGETEGEALGHNAQWNITSVDFNTLDTVKESKCTVCGEHLDSKNELLTSLHYNNLFLFDCKEFNNRLQHVYDELYGTELELTFKYAVSYDGYWNTDIYLDDLWIGYIVFWDRDFVLMDGDNENTRNISGVRLILPYEEADWDIYEMVYEMIAEAIIKTVDPTLEDGVYNDPIFANLYAFGGESGKSLHGLFYTCDLSGEDTLYFDVDIERSQYM